MPISVRDNKNNRWKRKAKTKQRQKQQRGGGRSYSERMRAKWFCCAFKLGFLQLIGEGEGVAERGKFPV